jgi:non-heme Fe2+,alpha-ketoglutarate-dependent halogenase
LFLKGSLDFEIRVDLRQRYHYGSAMSDQSSTSSTNLLEKYRRDGTCFPLEFLSSEETDYYRSQLLNFLEKVNWKLDAINRHKPHMYLKWANDLGKHPLLLKYVTQLLGPDVILWYSVIFVKPAQTRGRVPWHQDSTYWAMEKEEGLTAWIALSEVNVGNGCVRVIPGSQQWGDFKHRISNTRDNLLHRGQEIANIDEKNAVPVELKPGQLSLHDLRLLHSSEANDSPNPRLGIAFRFIPASNYPRTLKWLKRSATLVAGTKHHDYFRPDPVPRWDYDPEAMGAYRRSIRVAAVHTLFGDQSRSNLRKAFDTIPILISRKTADYFKYWRHLTE